MKPIRLKKGDKRKETGMETQSMQEVKDSDSSSQLQNQLINQALVEVNKAKDIVIVTRDDYSFADLMFKEIKGWIKKLDDEEKKITKPLLQGIEAARVLFRGPKQKANEVKEILNNRMVNWAEEEKRKERELQAKLEQAARKRAEEEALREALEAEAAGEKEEAEQIISEPIYIPPIKVVSEVPRSKESHIRETWSAEGIDLMATIRAIVEEKAPLQAVQYDMPFLNKQAISYKQALNIPGVKAVSKKTQI